MLKDILRGICWRRREKLWKDYLVFKLEYNEEHSGPKTHLCNIEGFGKEFVVLLSKLHEGWEFEIYSSDGRFPKIIFPNLKKEKVTPKDIEEYFNEHVLEVSREFVEKIFEYKLYD